MTVKYSSRNSFNVVKKQTCAVAKLGFAVSLLFLIACEPSDQTPGLWLGGNVIETFPGDWAFTDSNREIFVQVNTPYFLPHSVTIWCAQAGGELYIAARDPDTKNWVGWIGSNDEIRLKIGADVYDVAAQQLSEQKSIAVAAAAYQAKYDLGATGGAKKSTLKYWLITPRS